MAKAKAFGCQVCPWKEDKDDCFVKPETPRKPEIIVVGEAPGKTEHTEGIPF